MMMLLPGLMHVSTPGFPRFGPTLFFLLSIDEGVDGWMDDGCIDTHTTAQMDGTETRRSAPFLFHPFIHSSSFFGHVCIFSLLLYLTLP